MVENDNCDVCVFVSGWAGKKIMTAEVNHLLTRSTGLYGLVIVLKTAAHGNLV